MAKDPNKAVAKAQKKAEKKAKQGKRAMAQQARKNKKEKEGKSGGIREYLKGVRIEVKKVVWPTRKELVSYTGVVLFTCTIFGLAIWGLDSGFLATLKAILQITF